MAEQQTLTVPADFLRELRKWMGTLPYDTALPAIQALERVVAEATRPAEADE